jgi:hypothetical protein
MGTSAHALSKFFDTRRGVLPLLRKDDIPDQVAFKVNSGGGSYLQLAASIVALKVVAGKSAFWLQQSLACQYVHPMEKCVQKRNVTISGRRIYLGNRVQHETLPRVMLNPPLICWCAP